MTGPIKFNPFLGVGGTQNIEHIQDKKQNTGPTDLDSMQGKFSMNQGIDEEGAVDFDKMDFKMNKEIPKQ